MVLGGFRSFHVLVTTKAKYVQNQCSCHFNKIQRIFP